MSGLGRTGRPAGRRDKPGRSELGYSAKSAADSLRAVVPISALRPGRGAGRRVEDQLGDRDVEILRSLGGLRLMTAGQIQRLHFAAGSPLTQARKARRVLERLFRLGLVGRLDRRIGGTRAGSAGYIYRLSARGLRLLDAAGERGGRRRNYREPSIRFQDHVLELSELCVQLHEATSASDLEVVRFDAEPACWRSYADAGGGVIWLRPDAFVITTTDEVEQLSLLSSTGAQRPCQRFAGRSRPIWLTPAPASNKPSSARFQALSSWCPMHGELRRLPGYSGACRTLNVCAGSP